MDAQPPLFRSSATGMRYGGWLALGLLLTCGAPTFVCVEAGSVGPYTAWYNHHKKDLATKAGLVGRPIADIETVLGPADAIQEFDGYRTYEYYPYPLLPFSKFQVHTDNVVVFSLEMFDD